MPASQLNITLNTPLGANLASGGATFRAWAPEAHEVYLALNHPVGTAPAAFPKHAADLLTKHADGFWAGFVPGIKEGDLYRFYVVGTGSARFKRDPYARELEFNGYPDCNCLVRDPANYPWHDSGFRPPAFSDLIIYQFHIGVFYARDVAGNDIRRNRVCKILDVVDRIEYFADLGVNAIMPLPFQIV
jgi:1,4-alpha-glucan branching enzyme